MSILEPKIPDKPNFIFRRNITLKDNLAPSTIDPPVPIMGMFGNMKGFFPCKRCKMCKTSRNYENLNFYFQYYVKDVSNQQIHHLWDSGSHLFIDLPMWAPVCGENNTSSEDPDRLSIWQITEEDRGMHVQG